MSVNTFLPKIEFDVLDLSVLNSTEESPIFLARGTRKKTTELPRFASSS